MAPLVGQGPAVEWDPQAGPEVLAVGLDWAVAREAVVARRVPVEAAAVQNRRGAAAVQQAEDMTLRPGPTSGHSHIGFARLLNYRHWSFQLKKATQAKATKA